MVTNNNDARCSEDRVIQVYNSSFLALLGRSPRKPPAQFNQCRELFLNCVIKAAYLVHLVIKQAYKEINLVVQCSYKEHVLMKSLGCNILGKAVHSFTKPFAILTKILKICYTRISRSLAI